MSRGWDRGGLSIGDNSSWRLICGSGAGPDGCEGVGTFFRPNVLAGHCPFDGSGPEIVGLGLSDVAVEWWHCWKIYSSIPTVVGDMGPMLARFIGPGFADWNMRIVPAWVGLPWLPTDISVGLDPDDTIPPGITTMANIPIAVDRWSHVAANFDRNGNMDTYVNGQLLSSMAIGAMVLEVFQATRYYANTVANTDPANYNGVLDDMTTYHAKRYIVGLTAFHSRLLTVGEIRSSHLGKRVQNFGVPDTVVHWDWRNIERLDGEPICWEFGETNTHHSTLIGLEGKGMAMPTGAPGTLRVPDLSGSGNHWVLPTLATYQRTVALDELSSTAFLYDGFWSS